MPTPKQRLNAGVALGQVTWPRALAVLTGRSCFMILAQALVALVFLLRGRESPWNAAAPWWTVYATLVDIGCLVLLVKFTRVEDIRLRDLVGKIRLRWGHDIFLGIGCLAVMMFLFAIPGRLGLGIPQGAMQPGLLFGRKLPLGAVIYSLSIFWLVWLPTEEMTFNGYLLAWVQALTGRKWIGVVVGGFGGLSTTVFFPLYSIGNTWCDVSYSSCSEWWQSPQCISGFAGYRRSSSPIG